MLSSSLSYLAYCLIAVLTSQHFASYWALLLCMHAYAMFDAALLHPQDQADTMSI